MKDGPDQCIFETKDVPSCKQMWLSGKLGKSSPKREFPLPCLITCKTFPTIHGASEQEGNLEELSISTARLANAKESTCANHGDSKALLLVGSTLQVDPRSLYCLYFTIECRQDTNKLYTNKLDTNKSYQGFAALVGLFSWALLEWRHKWEFHLKQNDWDIWIYIYIWCIYIYMVYIYIWCIYIYGVYIYIYIWCIYIYMHIDIYAYRYIDVMYTYIYMYIYSIDDIHDMIYFHILGEINSSLGTCPGLKTPYLLQVAT